MPYEGPRSYRPLIMGRRGAVASNHPLATQAGLASGVVNTSFMMGGAVGLAVLASVAASRTDSLRASGEDAVHALTGGYHLAFLIGALFALAAAALGSALLRSPRPSAAPEEPAELVEV